MPSFGGIDVVLVSMPFASLTKPSLALGCLSAALREDGISTRSLYFGLDFAGSVELKDYAQLCEHRYIGEWIFSHAAFPGMEQNDDGFFQNCRIPLPRENILKIRDTAGGFIDSCVRKVLDLNPKIVGCSLSYLQTCASLALLRRIREAAPEIATVAGGVYCEGLLGVETHRSFPWVDYVFSGEADESFPDFCRAFLSGEKIGGDGGWNRGEVLTPRDRCPDGKCREPGRGVVADISSLPIPYFDDYFEALGKSSIKDDVIPGLILETSRGCWWGTKKPCTFCGVNGLFEKYRSKNPDIAYREITELTRKHGVKDIQIADNIIDPAHIEQLLPRFEGAGINFMFEVPAMLSKEQLRKLSNAGVRRMQPGMEQLNDELLAALGKPNRAFHNIRFLKWAREYGIDVIWNCLYGFPGEADTWYGEAADIVPLLVHLQAPNPLQVRFDRFSLYFNEQDRFGITLKPEKPHRYIYPLDEKSLSRMAYFFERSDLSAEKPLAEKFKAEQPGLERLLRNLDEWNKLFPPIYAKNKPKPPVLAMTRDAPDALIIEDTRPIAIAPRFSFNGIEANVYAAADEGGTLEEIAQTLPSKMPLNEVDDILQNFAASRLMVKLGGIYLSLAVASPFRDYFPEDKIPGGWFRRKNSAGTDGPGSVPLEQIFGLN